MMITTIIFNVLFAIIGIITSIMLGNMVDKITKTSTGLIGAVYTLILTTVVSIACDINSQWSLSITCSFLAILCGLMFTRCLATLVARAYSFTLGGLM